MMAAEGIARAVCVASECYPLGAGREAIYNCTSDAACAVLLAGKSGACAMPKLRTRTSISYRR